MLGDGIERGDVVVALGGGVVGDLAGYVAATGVAWGGTGPGAHDVAFRG
jgi:hypothetical protein